MRRHLRRCRPPGQGIGTQVTAPQGIGCVTVLWSFRTKLAASLFWFRRALYDPIARFRYLPVELAQSGAEVLGVAVMRAHTGAQLGFVNELVGVGAVLERRLGAE